MIRVIVHFLNVDFIYIDIFSHWMYFEKSILYQFIN